MPSRPKKQTSLDIRRVAPLLPGPWHYLDLLPMLTLVRNLTRDLPPATYPLVALVVWRTIQSEQKKRDQAVLEAEREAVRRSQRIYVVKVKPRKRFVLF